MSTVVNARRDEIASSEIERRFRELERRVALLEHAEKHRKPSHQERAELRRRVNTKE